MVMRREVVFAELKSTIQSVVHLLIVSKSIFRRTAAVTVLSTMVDRLVSSAIKSMKELMLFTNHLFR